MNNVGGSAGDGGFDFQACLIAFVGVHILAEMYLPGLESKGIPIAVSAETNGPGDDLQIEFIDSDVSIEIQAKKGLKVDDRFDKAINKIAFGLAQEKLSEAILAVDPSTAKRIKEKLSFDLDRFRQGRSDNPRDLDLLKRVTDIFAKYTQNEKDNVELIKRFSVLTFDIEGAMSPSSQVTLNLLRSNILIDKKKSFAAWDILVRDGHRLIKERGRHTGSSLTKLLLNRDIQLLGSLSAVVKENYQKWLSEVTATFSIIGPSLGKPLPIDAAWISLRSLNKELNQIPKDLKSQFENYHEWERLNKRDQSYDVENAASIGYRVVIVGGPGSGKSTLCRRLAHYLTSLEECVLWVRLPDVMSQVSKGCNIHEALMDSATNGFSITESSKNALFNHVDCLIADGLDECNSLISNMAEDIQRWASSHPQTRIVITTRPIGYNPLFFQNWQHQELLPIPQNYVERYARQIILALSDNKNTSQLGFKRFQYQLEKNRVASLASRNPLLLGFLIQLSLEGVTLAQYRSDLYEQILDLWHLTQFRDRKVTTHLNVSLAWRSLEIMGWLFLQGRSTIKACSHKKWIQQLSACLSEEMDLKPLVAQERAENCILFWLERGVIERLQFAHENVYIFVHATLGEYAAARYLQKLEPANIEKIVRDKRNDPYWREVILLAAGVGVADVIVKTLCSINSKSKVSSSESLLAIAVLGETSSYSDLIATDIIEIIREHLISPIPSVAYALVENAVGFASRSAIMLFPALRPLLYHSQLWTRLTALYLALLDQKNNEVLPIFENFIDEMLGKPLEDKSLGRFFTNPLNTLNKVIVLGIELIVESNKIDETKELIKRLYVSEIVSGITQEKLRKYFWEIGCKDFIEKQEKSYRESLKDFSHYFEKSRLADKRVLEIILQITGFPALKSKKKRKLYYLAKLFYSLNAADAPARDWIAFSQINDLEAIKSVFSGFASIFSIEKNELAKDATWVLAEIEEAENNGQNAPSLLGILPEFPINYDDYHADLQDVPILDLVRALNHPSGIIARGATWLLFVGNRMAEIASLLENGDEDKLQIIANIADELWKEEARSRLIERLDRGFTPGCNWLIERLPRLAGDHNDKQLIRTLLSALVNESRMISIAAVHALRELEQSLLLTLTDDIKQAFESWMKQISTYKVGSYYLSDECPTCRIAPGNPIAHLLQLLSQVQPLNITDLLALCHCEQREIRLVAAKELTIQLSSNPAYLPLALGRGVSSGLIIDAIFAVPANQLILIQDKLCDLISSENAQTRLKLVRALKTAEWLPLEKAKDIALLAFQDESPLVRDEALSTLQELEKKE